MVCTKNLIKYIFKYYCFNYFKIVIFLFICVYDYLPNCLYYFILYISLNNRQFKTTCQFAIYDFLKTIEHDADYHDRDTGELVTVEKIPKYRIVNMARLTSYLVKLFHIPMAMIKRIDMSNLSQNSILYVHNLFLSLFTIDVSIFCVYYYFMVDWFGLYCIVITTYKIY